MKADRMKAWLVGLDVSNWRCRTYADHRDPLDNKYELIAREYTGINALFHSNDPKVHLGHVARSKPMSR